MAVVMIHCTNDWELIGYNVELGEGRYHCPGICEALTAVGLKFCIMFASSLTNEVISVVDIIALFILYTPCILSQYS